MLTLSSLRQKSFSRAIKVVLRTEAESKAFSLAFQQWKQQVISGKAGLSFHDLFQIISSVHFVALFMSHYLMLVLIDTCISYLYFPSYLYHKRVKHLLWALLNSWLHTVILTCTVFLLAHAILQPGKISEFMSIHTLILSSWWNFMFLVIFRTSIFLLCISTDRPTR